MIQPGELGAPPHLATWRPEQEKLFQQMLSSGRRVDVVAAATGVGKSLLGFGYAQLMGARTGFLTSTNGLLDQYMLDFGPAGLHDVRGMGQYACHYDEPPQDTCDAGPCLDGVECPLRAGGCLYFDRQREAKESWLALTNYDYWMTHAEGGPLGPRDLIVADEAHVLPDKVARFAGAKFTSREVEVYPGMEFWGLGQWQEWVQESLRAAREALASGKLGQAARRDLRLLHAKFERLEGIDADWGWDVLPGKQITIEPIEPKGYVERLLWQGAPKIVMLSATIRPADLLALGLGPDDYHFFEVASPFPAERRPVYWVEVGFRLNASTSDLNLRYWVSRIDQIIERRLDRKGLIHTVSYARARYLKKHSRHAKYMVLPQGDELQTAVEEFKRLGPGAILVSPSVHTGYDFPYEAAEYQIIAKVPFPDTRAGLSKLRMERDQYWSIKRAIQTLEQMYGRVMRADDDLGETFITDDSMGFLFDHHRRLFSKSFRQAFRKMSAAPNPPERLGRES